MKIDIDEFEEIIELTDSATKADLKIVIGQANAADKKSAIKKSIKLYGKANKTYCACKRKGYLRGRKKALEQYEKATDSLDASLMTSLAEQFIKLSEQSNDKGRKLLLLKDGLIWYERAYQAGGEFDAQLCEQIGDINKSIDKYEGFQGAIRWHKRGIDAGNKQLSIKVAEDYLDWSQTNFLKSVREEWKEMAYEWYEKAANYGIVEGAVKYAQYCERQAKSGGNKTKTQLVIKWYEKAAELGSEEAVEKLKVFKQSVEQSEPELLYKKGMAAIKSGKYNSAVKLLSSSAELGYTDAIFQLAILCCDGKGDESDIEKATSLLNNLAEAGNAEAMYHLARLGKGKDAIELYKKAAEAGSEAAETELKNYYRKKKSNVAIEWLKGYAERHQDCEIMCYIAENSEGEDAYEWYLRAASTGDSTSKNKFEIYCYHQAMSYYNGDGKGNNSNYEKAFELFQTAANLGNFNAMYMLGICYKNGHGVAVDKDKMATWFLSAAKLLHVDAMFELGLCYLNGDGVMKDRNLMMSWFQKAADRGSKRAKNALLNLQIIKEVDEGYAKDVKKMQEQKAKAEQQAKTAQTIREQQQKQSAQQPMSAQQPAPPKYDKISLLTDGCEITIDRIGESKNGSMDIRSYDYESYMRLKVSVIAKREDFFGLIGAKDPYMLRTSMESELKYEYGRDYKKSIESEVMDFDDYLLDSRHYREDMQNINNSYNSYLKRNGDKVQNYLDNLIRRIWKEKPFYVLASGATYKYRNGASSNGEKVNCRLMGLKTIFKWYYES